MDTFTDRAIKTRKNAPFQLGTFPGLRALPEEGSTFGGHDFGGEKLTAHFHNCELELAIAGLGHTMDKYLNFCPCSQVLGIKALLATGTACPFVTSL